MELPPERHRESQTAGFEPEEPSETDVSIPDEPRVLSSRGGRGTAFWTSYLVIFVLGISLIAFRDVIRGEWYMMKLRDSETPDEQIRYIRGIRDVGYARALPVLTHVVRSNRNIDVSLEAIEAIDAIRAIERSE